MISVCIPSYNHDPSQLVHDLLANKGDVLLEILIVDDGSNEATQAKLQALTGSDVRIIRNEKNIGRSKSRNVLSKEAKYDYLLFIDADCLPEKPGEFLLQYLGYSSRHQVMCGGHVYRGDILKDTRLHFLFGEQRESRSAEERNQFPYRWVFTSNIWCPRDIALRHPFYENMVGYGYEDSLWASSLKEKGCAIYHIDNAVIHKGLKSRKQFFDDVDHSLRQLVEVPFLRANMDIRLNKVFHKLRGNGLGSLLLSGLSYSAPVLKSLTRYPLFTLYFLDLYKLAKINRLYQKILPKN